MSAKATHERSASSREAPRSRTMRDTIYEGRAEWKGRAFIDDAKYQAMYARSIEDPNGFWAEEARRIDWFKPFTKVKNTSFDTHRVSIKWCEGGITHMEHNVMDCH